MSTTLVFPVSTPDGRAYLDAAVRRAEPVVAASVDAKDPTGGASPWRHLPLVHEPSFLKAFLALVREFGVTRIRTGAHTVHAALSELLAREELSDLTIINPSALDQELERWRGDFQRADQWAETIATIAPEAPALDRSYLAGVIRQAFDTFGESYEDKLAVFLACLSTAPAGDIVEIGALFGRSASVLLSGRTLGGHDRSVFVFDPWCGAAAVQDDQSAVMQSYTRGADWPAIADAFEARFAACAPAERFAAFQAPSALGRKWYGGEEDLEPLRRARCLSPAEPSGSLAFLHIDGNHDAWAVRVDADLWASLVAPGGWVVFDDYLWRYGSGPKQAGDALLARWGDQVARAFTAGGALFIQRG